MKQIVFLTTSLEIGRNGVGDYTYTLAQYLGDFGVKVRIIALHDPYAEDVIYEKSKGIDQLRFPRSTPEKDKVSLTKKWLGNEKIDWFSLQLVAYGYHPKGLFYKVAKTVHEIVGKRYLQIYLHELWPGAVSVTSSKQKWWGFLQQHSFFHLINKTFPRLLHTSISTYKEYLESKNLIIEKLPLLCPIPFTTDDGSDPLPQKTDSARVLIFATIYENFDFSSCFQFLSDHFKSPVQIIHIGHNKTNTRKLENALVPFQGRITFEHLSDISEQQINQCFYRAHLGLSTTPASAIGKSSAYTAMKQTGLPVLAQECGLPTEVPSIRNEYPNVIVQEKEDPHSLKLSNYRLTPEDKNPEIAHSFFDILSSYDS